MNITSVDWIILVGSFFLFLIMAIYINTYVKSVADFLVSGRKVKMWLGLGAVVAGEIGLVTIVSVCEQGYMRAFGFVLIGIITSLVFVRSRKNLLLQKKHLRAVESTIMGTSNLRSGKTPGNIPVGAEIYGVRNIYRSYSCHGRGIFDVNRKNKILGFGKNGKRT